MIKCSHCGVENDDAVSACRSCGTLLNAPDVTSTTVPSPIPQIDAPPILSSAVEMPNTPAPRGKELKAGSAGIIFLVYFASQTLGSIIAMIIGFAMAAAHGQNLQDPQQIRRLVPALMPGIVLCTMIGGGVGMFVMAFVLVRAFLADRSPTGAAWVRGSWLEVGKGLALGLIVGLAGSAFMTYMERVTGGPSSESPLTTMAANSRSGFLVW